MGIYNLSPNKIVILILLAIILFTCLYISSKKIKENYVDSPKVTIWNGQNNFTLQLGKYNQENLPTLKDQFNNTFTKIEVPDGLKVIGYVEPNFEGDSYLFFPGITNPTYLTKIRSIEVEELDENSITLSRNHNFRSTGKTDIITVIDDADNLEKVHKISNINITRNFLNDVKEIYVSADTFIEIYKNKFFQGTSLKLKPGHHNLDELKFSGSKASGAIGSIKFVNRVKKPVRSVYQCKNSDKTKCLPDGTEWENIGGNFRQIDSDGGTTVGLQYDGKVFVLVDDEGDLTWVEPNESTRMKYISASGNTIWGIKPSGYLAISTDKGNNWKDYDTLLGREGITELSRMRQIDQNNNKLLVTNLWGSPITIEKQGSKWTGKHIGGSGFKYISFGRNAVGKGVDSNVYALDMNGTPYKYNPATSTWKIIPSIPGGAFKSVEANKNQLMGISMDRKVFEYNSSNNTWKEVKGEFDQLTIGDNAIYAIKEKSVYPELIGMNNKGVVKKVELRAGAYDNTKKIYDKIQVYPIPRSGPQFLKAKPTGISNKMEKTLIVPPGYQVTTWTSEFSGTSSRYRAGLHRHINKNISSFFVEKIPMTRYVRIEKPYTYLNFIEVEIYDNHNVNVAYGKPCMQHPNYYNYHPNNGTNGWVDGHHTGNLAYFINNNDNYPDEFKNKTSNVQLWVHTDQPVANDKDNAWWEVDLGKEYDIDRIMLYNRFHGEWYRMNNAKVLLLNNNRIIVHKTRITDKYELDYYPGPQKTFNFKDLNLEVQRIKIERESWLTLGCVDVYDINDVNVTQTYGYTTNTSDTSKNIIETNSTHPSTTSTVYNMTNPLRRNGTTNNRYSNTPSWYYHSDNKNSWWQVTLVNPIKIKYADIYGRADYKQLWDGLKVILQKKNGTEWETIHQAKIEDESTPMKYITHRRRQQIPIEIKTKYVNYVKKVRFTTYNDILIIALAEMYNQNKQNQCGLNSSNTFKINWNAEKISGGKTQYLKDESKHYNHYFHISNHKTGEKTIWIEYEFSNPFALKFIDLYVHNEHYLNMGKHNATRIELFDENNQLIDVEPDTKSQYIANSFGAHGHNFYASYSFTHLIYPHEAKYLFDQDKQETKPTIAIPSQNQTALKNVYRHVSKWYNNYHFTTSPVQIEGYKYEGIPFKVLSTQQANTIPIYCCPTLRQDGMIDSILTTNANCDEKELRTAQLNKELLGYVYTNQTYGSAALHLIKLKNPDNHTLTASEFEKDQLVSQGAEFIKILGYAPTIAPTTITTAPTVAPTTITTAPIVKVPIETQSPKPNIQINKTIHQNLQNIGEYVTVTSTSRHTNKTLQINYGNGKSVSTYNIETNGWEKYLPAGSKLWIYPAERLSIPCASTGGQLITKKEVMGSTLKITTHMLQHSPPILSRNKFEHAETLAFIPENLLLSNDTCYKPTLGAMCRGSKWNENGWPVYKEYITPMECQTLCNNDPECTGYDITDPKDNYKFKCVVFGNKINPESVNSGGMCAVKYSNARASNPVPPTIKAKVESLLSTPTPTPTPTKDLNQLHGMLSQGTQEDQGISILGQNIDKNLSTEMPYGPRAYSEITIPAAPTVPFTPAPTQSIVDYLKQLKEDKLPDQPELDKTLISELSGKIVSGLFLNPPTSFEGKIFKKGVIGTQVCDENGICQTDIVFKTPGPTFTEPVTITPTMTPFASQTNAQETENPFASTSATFTPTPSTTSNISGAIPTKTPENIYNV